MLASARASNSKQIEGLRAVQGCRLLDGSSCLSFDTHASRHFINTSVRLQTFAACSIPVGAGSRAIVARAPTGVQLSIGGRHDGGPAGAPHQHGLNGCAIYWRPACTAGQIRNQLCIETIISYIFLALIVLDAVHGLSPLPAAIYCNCTDIILGKGNMGRHSPRSRERDFAYRVVEEGS